MSQFHRTLLCGNPASFVVKVGRSVIDKHNIIKLKGTR